MEQDVSGRGGGEEAKTVQTREGGPGGPRTQSTGAGSVPMDQEDLHPSLVLFPSIIKLARPPAPLRASAAMTRSIYPRGSPPPPPALWGAGRGVPSRDYNMEPEWLRTESICPHRTGAHPWPLGRDVCVNGDWGKPRLDGGVVSKGSSLGVRTPSGSFCVGGGASFSGKVVPS